MKPLLPVLLMLTLIQAVQAQKVKQISAVSEKILISVEPISGTPYLEITNYRFGDENQNNKIDAGETDTIYFDLKNTGSGEAKDLKIKVSSIADIEGLTYRVPSELADLKVGQTRRMQIPVVGSLDLETGLAASRLEIIEPNRFNSDPLLLEIETQAFRPPLVKLVDYQVSSQSGNTLQKRVPFDLEVLIQNLGQGTADDIDVQVEVPGNVFNLTSNIEEHIDKLMPGEKKLISYNFVANNEYTSDSINFIFRISEKYDNYAEDGTVALAMEQRISQEKLVVKGTEEKDVKIAVASLTSDVDKNIPVVAEKKPQKLALIIGNENYAQSVKSEINVEYARRDAGVFYEYVIKTLGLVEENVYFKTDATAGTMNTEIDRITELIKRMGPETELIFYYSGHGFPNDKTYAPYLIPVDVNASNLGSAIELKDVYQKFGSAGAKKITVILDACFSGGGRNQGLLAARSVRIKPKDEELAGNMVVFSAASGEQSALPYHEEQHGIFTYYLLKKLKETEGKVSFGELDRYLRNEVGIGSIRINGMVQDPVTNVSPAIENKWENLTF